MKILATVNEKGGVGKTTVATHLAAGLAIRGYNVLLVDADGQGHATMAFGLQKGPGFYDTIVRDAKFEDVLRLVPYSAYMEGDGDTPKGRLLLIPGNNETRNIANNIDDPRLVLLKLYVLRDIVDYIIIDTSPSTSLLHAMIYVASDGLIYPTRCEKLSFDGLRESMAHLDYTADFRARYNLPATEVIGILPTYYRGNTVEHSEGLKKLQHLFGAKVWDAIPMSILWAEASGASRMVWGIAPDSQPATHAWGIVNRVEAIYEQA